MLSDFSNEESMLIFKTIKIGTAVFANLSLRTRKCCPLYKCGYDKLS